MKSYSKDVLAVLAALHAVYSTAYHVVDASELICCLYINVTLQGC